MTAQIVPRNSCARLHLRSNYPAGEYLEVIEKVNAKTMVHQDIYKQRCCIVEHPFCTIKQHLGYTYFLRQGIENVDAECTSMFIAYNLKRLLDILSVPELIKSS